MIRNAIQRFMYGRYGTDQLNLALLGLYLVLYLVSALTRWGVLYAAEQQREVVFSPPEDSASSGPCLLGAAPLLDGSGQIAGFLLIRLEQSDLNDLLGGAVCTSNNLLLLSAYWRPVYCSQSGLSVSLANTLRQRLLSGQPLNSRSEAFTYTVSHHPSTGLYMVLGQPQMFTRDTMGLLYTVSASCALACLARAGRPFP